MYEGDRSRKTMLVDHGFRLPSAMDNRPLRFEEFIEKVPQVVFVSATPGEWETSVSTQVVEQLVRPTGLVDPMVEVRPTKHQIDDLMNEIRDRVDKGQRTLVTTLTKKMAEDLTDYLLEMGFRVRYLHSEVDTLERIRTIRELRLGEVDVLVGINLLREGLDLPEVTLVAILDADKEGFLRGETALIQTIGRAARNVEGKVIMYADKRTAAMDRAISETDRRRAAQLAFNEAHGIEPRTIVKGVSRHRRAAGHQRLACRTRSGARPPAGRTCRPRRSSASWPPWRRRCSRPPRSCASSMPPSCATRSRTWRATSPACGATGEAGRRRHGREAKTVGRRASGTGVRPGWPARLRYSTLTVRTSCRSADQHRSACSASRLRGRSSSRWMVSLVVVARRHAHLLDDHVGLLQHVDELGQGRVARGVEMHAHGDLPADPR